MRDLTDTDTSSLFLSSNLRQSIWAMKVRKEVCYGLDREDFSWWFICWSLREELGNFHTWFIILWLHDSRKTMMILIIIVCHDLWNKLSLISPRFFICFFFLEMNKPLFFDSREVETFSFALDHLWEEKLIPITFREGNHFPLFIPSSLWFFMAEKKFRHQKGKKLVCGIKNKSETQRKFGFLLKMNPCCCPFSIVSIVDFLIWQPLLIKQHSFQSYSWVSYLLRGDNTNSSQSLTRFLLTIRQMEKETSVCSFLQETHRDSWPEKQMRNIFTADAEPCNLDFSWARIRAVFCLKMRERVSQFCSTCCLVVVSPVIFGVSHWRFFVGKRTAIAGSHYLRRLPFIPYWSWLQFPWDYRTLQFRREGQEC